MSDPSSAFNPDKLSRLVLIVAAALLVLLLVLTGFNIAVRIPDEAETDAFGDPLDTSLSDEEWETDE